MTSCLLHKLLLLLYLTQEGVDHLHKGRKLAAVNIVGGARGLDGTAAWRQKLLSLLPDGVIQDRPKGSISPNQECRSDNVSQTWQQTTTLTRLSKDADYRLPAHLLQRLDLALNIGLSPARIVGRDFDP